MRNFSSIFEGAEITLSEAFNLQVNFGLMGDLLNWIDTSSSMVDAFLLYSGFERGMALDGGYVGIIHKFELYLRKTKLENTEVPQEILRCIEIAEDVGVLEFNVRNKTWKMYFDALYGEVVHGEYLLKIPIEVIG